MSTKLFEAVQETLNDSEQGNNLNDNQKKWRNTWSFRCHSNIPFYEQRGILSQGKDAKKLIQKYYGRKVLYVSKPREANSMISRSKLIKSMSISESCIMKRSLKSRGDLVILDTNLRCLNHLFEFSESYGEWSVKKSEPLKKDIHYLHFKKMIKYCQKADIGMWMKAHPGFLKYMSNLKHLSLKSSPKHDAESFGNLLVKLEHLESLKFTYAEVRDYTSLMRNRHDEVEPSAKERKDKKFFSKLHDLTHLKKMTFIADSEVFQRYFQGMEQDLEMFYSKSLKFRLRWKILCKRQRGMKGFDDSGVEISPMLKCMLQKAEYLKVDAVEDKSLGQNVQKATQKIKAGKNNIVDIRIMTSINIRVILSSCDSLQALVLKRSYYNLDWKIDPESDQEIKAFAHLQNVVLNFSLLKMQTELFSASNVEQYAAIPHLKCNLDPKKPEEQSIVSTTLWTLLSELKQKCHSLQDLSLFLGLSHINDENQRRFLDALYDDICRFDRLKLFHFYTDTTNFDVLPPSRILANKNLDTLKLELDREEDSSARVQRKESPEWDRYFALDNASHIKKLSVDIALKMKIPLCGPSLLVNLQKLKNLQVIELVDRSNKVMTFDFLYGLLMELLGKKTMRKILVCTNVNNGFYSTGEDASQDTGRFFSEDLNNYLGIMMKKVYEDLETRVEKLKGFELEEIMVGKLKGYSFDYMLYNKEMKIVDKIFWKKKEMEGLFHKKKQLRDSYNHLFYLYKTHDDFINSSSANRAGLFG